MDGVHNRLHIYPLCGIFYFPWHRHQIEGTNSFYCLIRKTERFTISNVESQVFTPKINMPGPGIEPRSPACQAGMLTSALPSTWTVKYINATVPNQSVNKSNGIVQTNINITCRASMHRFTRHDKHDFSINSTSLQVFIN